MKELCFIILLVLLTLSGCKKNDNSRNYGTMTISNEAADQNYSVYGFYVPTGQKVLNLSNQQDVITIQPDFKVDYTVRKLYFAANNLYNSFYQFGKYSDGAAASQAFKNLTSFSSPQWDQLGDSVMANQIWLFKTSDEKYAKLRIISTFTEKRAAMPFPYAECTFEWVYQPDGSLTFPGK
jgi:hypothetical protein